MIIKYEVSVTVINLNFIALVSYESDSEEVETNTGSLMTMHTEEFHLISVHCVDAPDIDMEHIREHFDDDIYDEALAGARIKFENNELGEVA